MKSGHQMRKGSSVQSEKAVDSRGEGQGQHSHLTLEVIASCDYVVYLLFCRNPLQTHGPKKRLRICWFKILQGRVSPQGSASTSLTGGVCSEGSALLLSLCSLRASPSALASRVWTSYLVTWGPQKHKGRGFQAFSRLGLWLILPKGHESWRGGDRLPQWWTLKALYLQTWAFPEVSGEADCTLRCRLKISIPCTLVDKDGYTCLGLSPSQSQDPFMTMKALRLRM